MVSLSRTPRKHNVGSILSKDTQNWAINMNNYFMHGDHSHLMKTLKL